jgi:hypothetical protein
MRRGRVSWWIYLAIALALAIIAVFWLEWLGSERPLAKTEQPVTLPAPNKKTGSQVEKQSN